MLQWQTVPKDVSRLDAWKRITLPPGAGGEPFPGLKVEYYNRNGTAQLTGDSASQAPCKAWNAVLCFLHFLQHPIMRVCFAVSKDFWEGPRSNVKAALSFMEDIEQLIGTIMEMSQAALPPFEMSVQLPLLAVCGGHQQGAHQ